MNKPFPALTLLALCFIVSSPQPLRAGGASSKPVLTTLHRFDGTHGENPATTLTPGTDGNFYGVTSSPDFSNFGTVFSMTPAGQVKTLFRFNYKIGYSPNGPLVQGPDGALYGTTTFGGKDNAGIVYRLTADGAFTTLHEFNVSTRADEGFYPYAGLYRAADGSLYGTAGAGGGEGFGTVFRISPGGAYSVLHRFVGAQGGAPSGTLVPGPDGALYGTAVYGGSKGHGVAFRVTLSGDFRVLHSFTGTDGASPTASLVAGPDGAFYGLTRTDFIVGSGGAYKITPSGTFTLLHKFSNDGHGLNPYSALMLGADGLFYGTTAFGGTNNAGTVFSMTPAGAVTTLYKFHTAFDGNTPYGGVVFGPDGALYGTTYQGGATNFGTIYKLTLP